MEAALTIARSFFLHLMKFNIKQEWNAVFGVMQHAHAQDALRTKKNSADFKIPEEGPSAVWGLDMAKVLFYISTQYLGKGKGKEVLDSFGTYFQMLSRNRSVSSLSMTDPSRSMMPLPSGSPRFLGLPTTTPTYTFPSPWCPKPRQPTLTKWTNISQQPMQITRTACTWTCQWSAYPCRRRLLHH